jgi:DNA-binding transcriptional ArsR family regulator
MVFETTKIEKLEQGTEVLRAIAHPLRILIIDMLYHHLAMSVTEIHEQLNIEQAVASHHLRILKDRGVVSVKRDGKNSFYTLTHEGYFTIIAQLGKVLPK